MCSSHDRNNDNASSSVHLHSSFTDNEHETPYPDYPINNLSVKLNKMSDRSFAESQCNFRITNPLIPEIICDVKSTNLDTVEITYELAVRSTVGKESMQTISKNLSVFEVDHATKTAARDLSARIENPKFKFKDSCGILNDDKNRDIFEVSEVKNENTCKNLPNSFENEHYSPGTSSFQNVKVLRELVVKMESQIDSELKSDSNTNLTDKINVFNRNNFSAIGNSNVWEEIIDSKIHKDINFNLSVAIPNQCLNSEKVLKDKLNEAKICESELGNNSVNQIYASNENLDMIPQYSKFHSNLLFPQEIESEGLTNSLNPNSENRSSLQYYDIKTDSCNILSPSTDKITHYMDSLHISSNTNDTNENDSAFVTGNNSSDLECPIQVSGQAGTESISTEKTNAFTYNRENAALCMKQEELEEFCSFQLSPMQVTCNQMDLIQSFESECNFECGSNKELYAVCNVGTPDCLREIDSILNDFGGILPLKSFSQNDEDMQVEEADCNAVDHCDDRFADGSERYV